MKNILFAAALATIVFCRESWSRSITCSSFLENKSVAVSLSGGVLEAGDLFRQEVRRLDMKVRATPFLSCAPFKDIADEERKCIVTHSGSDNVNNGGHAIMSMLGHLHSVQRSQKTELDLFLGSVDLPESDQFDAHKVSGASVWITGPHSDKTGVPGLYEFRDARNRVLLRVLNHHSPTWCK